MTGRHWLDTIIGLYRQQQQLSERAASQIGDEDFFTPLGENENSIAILMKHVGGNHLSRWHDFLTTDGEKLDRNRDHEFEVTGNTRISIEARWRSGWSVAFDTLQSLRPEDLERTITIRGEPMSVVEAIQRNASHTSYHTGQIVQLARHFAGDSWQSLSVPRGKSHEHNATMQARYGDWWARKDEP